MIILAFLLVVLGLYLSVYVAYQLLLFAANALIPDAPEGPRGKIRKFNVIVPAHNEELHIPRLLASFDLQDYPKESRRVTVVADNCSDGTTAVCSRFDVDILERLDTERTGKGHAIRWALGQIDLGRFDAVVVVDGDSVVDSGFLKHLNVQMDHGDRVIQSYNGIANPGQSWFTRLLNVSRTIANDILHPAKRKLGLSSYLMGNGMCFDVQILRLHEWNAFSVGEDWEYYARLVLSSVDVGYSRRARVFHQESVNLRQATSQRLRWSGGRFQVLREYGPALLRQGIRERNLKYVDASLPLILPNPSLGMNLTFVGVALALTYRYFSGGAGIAQWYAVLGGLQLLMFLIGAFHTENKVASLLSLVVAPVFLAWKMAIDILSICGVGRKQWKATERLS